MPPELHFHVEVLAPNGLAGIEPFLSECQLGVTTRRSGFNGQVILVMDDRTEDLDFAMDPSTEESMHGSGYISCEPELAWGRLMSLSHALKRAGFPHWIGMDDDHAGSAYLFCHGCSWSGSPRWNAA